jgi:hypothetical protein
LVLRIGNIKKSEREKGENGKRKEKEQKSGAKGWYCLLILPCLLHEAN